MDMIIQNKTANTTITLSAVEIYFDDCFDLLNNKVQIPISGFGASIKARPASF
jgi:hypothetical protein